MSDNQNDPQEKEVFEDCSDGENNKDTAAPEEEEEEIEEIYVNAEEDYKKALGFKNEGNNLYKDGKYEESIEMYTQAIFTCPNIKEYKSDLSIFYCNRAACKIELNLTDSAIEDCDKSIELNEKYIKAYVRRAQCYSKLDKLDEVQADYAKILELDPSLREIRRKKAVVDKQIEERNEKLKKEMLDKLKVLGNKVLGKFGMSLDNFKLEQDPKTGGYNVKFQQNPTH